MKKLKFILLLTVLLTTFSCQSGKQKVQSKEEKSINEFVAHLTEVDTVLITNLINQFMEYAKNGQLESAAAMLYKPIWQMFGMNLFNWITMNCIKSQKCWNLFLY